MREATSLADLGISTRPARVVKPKVNSLSTLLSFMRNHNGTYFSAGTLRPLGGRTQQLQRVQATAQEVAAFAVAQSRQRKGNKGP